MTTNLIPGYIKTWLILLSKQQLKERKKQKKKKKTKNAKLRGSDKFLSHKMTFIVISFLHESK